VVGRESLYAVSSLGCVRRADGLVLVPHLNHGHPTVVLKRDGKGSVLGGRMVSKWLANARSAQQLLA
jgi:hypothetical protein